MNKKIHSHFKGVDPILFEWIEKIELTEIPKATNLFEELCDEIISQQLSGKAASTIFERFKKLFPGGEVTTDKLLELPDEKIRECGTSWAKVKFLKDLADKVKTDQLQLNKLKDLPDEEVMKELMSVKGIGPWTAEMFMMFSLGREDI